MTDASSYFRGRKLVIATMHGKEQVLAPILEKALGVDIVLAPQLNTDAFGTFTGETTRVLSPEDAAVEKCMTAMALTQCDLAVANEGSFGPHPLIGFVASDEEWVVLIDRKNDFRIIAREISTATNFDAQHCFTIDELLSFADKVSFPSHALILQPAQDDFSKIVKGVVDPQQLQQEGHAFLSAYGSVYASTDMRAMFNPARMKVIAAAAEKLIEKINTRCDDCGKPGFEVKEVIPGLPCSACGSATRSTMAWVYVCNHCRFRKQTDFPHLKTSEDPMYCDQCNP